MCCITAAISKFISLATCLNELFYPAFCQVLKQTNRSFSSHFKETRPNSHFTESFSPVPQLSETIDKFIIEKFNLTFLFHWHFLMLPEAVNQFNTDNQKKVAVDYWVLTQDFKFMELPLHCPYPLKQEYQRANPEGSSSFFLSKKSGQLANGLLICWL